MPRGLRILDPDRLCSRVHAQGSCGYGMLDKSKYPFWSVGALSTSNMYYGMGPVQGCGCAAPPFLGSLICHLQCFEQLWEHHCCFRVAVRHAGHGFVKVLIAWCAGSASRCSASRTTGNLRCADSARRMHRHEAMQASTQHPRTLSACLNTVSVCARGSMHAEHPSSA